MAQEKKPTHKIRYGAIQASIWKNESNTGDSWYSVTLGRRYKDDDEHWQTSHSLGMRDLPLLVSASQSAYQWIHENTGTEKGEAKEGAEVETRLYKKSAKSKRRSA